MAVKIETVGTKPCPDCGEPMMVFAFDGAISDEKHVCGFVADKMAALIEQYGTDAEIHIEGEFG